MSNSINSVLEYLKDERQICLNNIGFELQVLIKVIEDWTDGKTKNYGDFCENFENLSHKIGKLNTNLSDIEFLIKLANNAGTDEGLSVFTSYVTNCIKNSEGYSDKPVFYEHFIKTSNLKVEKIKNSTFESNFDFNWLKEIPEIGETLIARNFNSNLCKEVSQIMNLGKY